MSHTTTTTATDTTMKSSSPSYFSRWNFHLFLLFLLCQSVGFLLFLSLSHTESSATIPFISKYLFSLPLPPPVLSLLGVGSFSFRQNLYIDEHAMLPTAKYFPMEENYQILTAKIHKKMSKHTFPFLPNEFIRENVKEITVFLQEFSLSVECKQRETNGTMRCVCVLDSPLGDGKEAILMVSVVSFIQSNENDNSFPSLSLSPSSLPFTLSLIRSLRLSKDLYRDYIFVFDIFGDRYENDFDLYSMSSDFHFPQVGLTDSKYSLIGGIILDFPLNFPFNSVVLNTRGRWGIQPNLDFVSAFIETANTNSLHIHIDNKWSEREKNNNNGDIYNGIKDFLKLTIQYALEVGTKRNSHGPLLQRGTDCMTITPKRILPSDPTYSALTVDFLRIDHLSPSSFPSSSVGFSNRLHSVFHQYLNSLQNLIEKLHHSTSLYFIVNAKEFITMSKYIYSFVLLVAPFPLCVIFGLREFYFGMGNIRETLGMGNKIQIIQMGILIVSHPMAIITTEFITQTQWGGHKVIGNLNDRHSDNDGHQRFICAYSLVISSIVLITLSISKIFFPSPSPSSPQVPPLLLLLFKSLIIFILFLMSPFVAIANFPLSILMVGMMDLTQMIQIKTKEKEKKNPKIPSESKETLTSPSLSSSSSLLSFFCPLFQWNVFLLSIWNPFTLYGFIHLFSTPLGKWQWKWEPMENFCENTFHLFVSHLLTIGSAVSSTWEKCSPTQNTMANENSPFFFISLLDALSELPLIIILIHFLFIPSMALTMITITWTWTKSNKIQ